MVVFKSMIKLLIQWRKGPSVPQITRQQEWSFTKLRDSKKHKQPHPSWLYYMQNEFSLGPANFSFCFNFQGCFRDAQEFVCCFALKKHVWLLPCKCAWLWCKVTATMRTSSHKTTSMSRPWGKSELQKYKKQYQQYCPKCRQAHGWLILENPG